MDRQSIFRIARKIGLFYAHAIRHFGYFVRFRAVALHFGYMYIVYSLSVQKRESDQLWPSVCIIKVLGQSAKR